MFSKKRRSVSTPPTNRAPVTSAAAAAAAQAFQKKQSADVGLSAAAAAAALRSHASSPTPIGEIQTKRMQRRGSTSSYGSAAGSTIGSARPQGLQRRTSSSSMTERTFRSPSPSMRNRVPLVPDVPTQVPKAPARQRSTSLQPPARVKSPTPAPPRASAMKKTTAYGGLGNITEQREKEQVEDVGPRQPTNYLRPMSPPLTTRAPKEAPPRQRPASSQGFYATDQGGHRKIKAIASPANRNSTSLVPAVRAAALAGQNASTPQRARASSSASAIPTTATSAAAARTRAQPMPKPGSVGIDGPLSRTGFPIQRTTGVAAAASAGPASPPPRERPQSAMGHRPTGSMVPRPQSAMGRPTGTMVDRPQSPAMSIDGANQMAKKRVQLNLDTERISSKAPSTSTGPLTVPSPTAQQMHVFRTRAASWLAPVSPDGSAVSPPRLPSTQSVYNGTQHSRTVSQPVHAPAPAASTVKRTPSVSPARSAHFASAPFLETIKHQPPPRSKSPAKSALKPASIRTNSPSGSARFTDNSADEAASGFKKKKSARVSFDPQPSTNVPQPAPVASQQGQWNGDMEQRMGPRPALPVFGSVRGRKGSRDSIPSSEGMPRAVNGKGSNFLPAFLASLPPQISAQPTLQPIEVSSATAKTDMVRTSVTEEGSTAEYSVNGVVAATDVPAIAVLPSTPALEEYVERGEHLATKPESFVETSVPDSGLGLIQPINGLGIDHTEQYTPQEADREIGHTVSELSPVGLAEESYSAPSQAVNGLESHEDDLSHVDDHSASDHILHEELEEAQEHYDNATEEPSQVEEGGFASLATVLGYPAATTHLDATKGSWGLLTGEEHEEAEAPTEAPAEAQDWDRVRAYWSSLSEQRKYQLEQEAARQLELQNAEQERGIATEAERASSPPVSPGGSRSPGRRTNGLPLQITRAPSAAVGAVGQPAYPPWPDQQYQESVTRAQPPPMRQSMRTRNAQDGPEPVPQKMRSSMRDTGVRDENNVRPQSVMVDGSPSLRKGPRPVSTGQLPPQRPMPAKSAMKPTLKPGLPRTFSNDSSGSESSFRKSRRRATSVTEDGRYSMRRSMRRPPAGQHSDDRPQSPTPSRLGKLSMRSPSPSASITSSRMRSSLRNPEPKTSSMMGFGKPSKPRKLGTRFNDSSEDEAPRGNRGTFRSRFVDSDDEDDFTSPPASNTRFKSMRGSARKGGYGEDNFTDADHANAWSTMNGKPTTPPIADGQAQGTALTAGTLRTSAVTEESLKRRNKFSSFGRQSESTPNTPSKSLLRRLSMSRSTSNTPNGEYAPQDYPFPPPSIPQGYRAEVSPQATTYAETATAPASAGGLTAAELAQRMHATGAKKAPILSKNTGKKKKFQGLRRMFGLND